MLPSCMPSEWTTGSTSSPCRASRWSPSGSASSQRAAPVTPSRSWALAGPWGSVRALSGAWAAVARAGRWAARRGCPAQCLPWRLQALGRGRWPRAQGRPEASGPGASTAAAPQAFPGWPRRRGRSLSPQAGLRCLRRPPESSHPQRATAACCPRPCGPIRRLRPLAATCPRRRRPVHGLPKSQVLQGRRVLRWQLVQRSSSSEP
mmetsp:Transcript_100166/g.323078  ORF Transcript_100166/g.323078 Transcript_100166/m.323078 type:complete len:205 (+) Transcript_100166:382-996(+)